MTLGFSCYCCYCSFRFYFSFRLSKSIDQTVNGLLMLFGLCSTCFALHVFFNIVFFCCWLFSRTTFQHDRKWTSIDKMKKIFQNFLLNSFCWTESFYIFTVFLGGFDKWQICLELTSILLFSKIPIHDAKHCLGAIFFLRPQTALFWYFTFSLIGTWFSINFLHNFFLSN
jgi:hypothetical protein